jgi:hypothetical protein
MEDHTMEDCPSFPGLQAIFKQGSDPIPPPLQTTQRRPWKQYIDYLDYLLVKDDGDVARPYPKKVLIKFYFVCLLC